MLRTQKLKVGIETFVLSEFTALDRIEELRYSIQMKPATPLPEEASREEKITASIQQEEQILDQVAYSIALSLMHGNAIDDDVMDVKEKIKFWPNRKVNQAYEILKSLNSIPADDDETPPDEDVTLEKS